MYLCLSVDSAGEEKTSLILTNFTLHMSTRIEYMHEKVFWNSLKNDTHFGLKTPKIKVKIKNCFKNT